MKGSVQGAFLIGVMVFLVLFPTMLILTEMWSMMRPIVTNSTITGNNATVNARITNLGNSFFYYSGDSIIVFMYFALVGALFLSALYEAARPETLPIGLLFMIPLIIVTLPLADLSHWFWSNPGFSNIAVYYQNTEYLSDWSPLITALVTISYLLFVVTKKQVFGGGSGGGGSNVVSG